MRAPIAMIAITALGFGSPASRAQEHEAETQPNPKSRVFRPTDFARSVGLVDPAPPASKSEPQSKPDPSLMEKAIGGIAENNPDFLKELAKFGLKAAKESPELLPKPGDSQKSNAASKLAEHPAIRDLMNDPEIKKLMQDPELLKAAAELAKANGNQQVGEALEGLSALQQEKKAADNRDQALDLAKKLMSESPETFKKLADLAGLNSKAEPRGEAAAQKRQAARSQVAADPVANELINNQALGDALKGSKSNPELQTKRGMLEAQDPETARALGGLEKVQREEAARRQASGADARTLDRANEALRENPQIARDLSRLGEGLGERRARERAERALRNDPAVRDLSQDRDLRDLLRDPARLKKAEEDLKAEGKSSSEGAGAANALEGVKKLQGRFEPSPDELQKELDRAVAEIKENPKLREQLAEIGDGKGDAAEAVREAVAADPAARKFLDSPELSKALSDPEMQAGLRDLARQFGIDPETAAKAAKSLGQLAQDGATGEGAVGTSGEGVVRQGNPRAHQGSTSDSGVTKSGERTIAKAGESNAAKPSEGGTNESGEQSAKKGVDGSAVVQGEGEGSKGRKTGARTGSEAGKRSDLVARRPSAAARAEETREATAGAKDAVKGLTGENGMFKGWTDLVKGLHGGSGDSQKRAADPRAGRPQNSPVAAKADPEAPKPVRSGAISSGAAKLGSWVSDWSQNLAKQVGGVQAPRMSRPELPRGGLSSLTKL
ncbi:MAG TPA: hypothetical protein VNC50_01875, partial [Planctomycetia bacterium]|nr:hypothetical protein [Planctomycetia bacterium]